jgi:hypothetical protein
MKHDQKQNSLPGEVPMTSSTEFSELTKKLLCEAPLTYQDLVTPSGISLGADESPAWRREAHTKLLTCAAPSAVLVLASEIIASAHQEILDHSSIRAHAFGAISDKVTKEELFQLGIISCIANPKRSEFGVLQRMFERFPASTLQLCEDMALNRDNTFDVRERGLLFILEEDSGRARHIAEQLLSRNDSSEAHNIAQEFMSSIPAGTTYTFRTSPEFPPELYSTAVEAGSAMANKSLSAQDISSKVHALVGESFVAYVCDLALYRDRTRNDYQEPLKKLVAAIPELKFLRPN